MSKSLDIKILGTKSLAGVDAVFCFLRTVTVLGMMARLKFTVKVVGTTGLWRLALIRIGDWRVRAYNIAMEISLAPEVEARLARIASEAGKPANQVVQELVANYVDHDEWFKREVQKGLDSLDGGKFVSHEEVGRQIERILRS
jgi:predicted transcriptional regulator